MKPIGLHALSGTAVLIVLVNSVALLGVAWNRHGSPDSVLTLSERELLTPLKFYFPTKENSGLTLELNWSIEPPRRNRGLAGDAVAFGFPGAGRWSAATWLDEAKLATLGFDVSRPLNAAESRDHYQRMHGRDVLLVLEMNGAAYTAALARARESAAQYEARAAAKPEDALLAQRADRVRDLARRLELESRLFVVDAGLDRDALRNRYPDRSHYAIVRGSVRPRIEGEGAAAELYGSITALRCESINVPLQFRDSVPQSVNPFDSTRAPRPFQVTVAFGRRLEPWVIAASAPPAAASAPGS